MIAKLRSDSDELWEAVLPLLERLAKQVIFREPALIYSLGHSATDKFLLRAFLGFQKNADGDELAITIDAVLTNSSLKLSSDVSRDNGEIVVVGPSSEISKSSLLLEPRTELESWLSDFERFLQTAEAVIVDRASDLL